MVQWRGICLTRLVGYESTSQPALLSSHKTCASGESTCQIILSF